MPKDQTTDTSLSDFSFDSDDNSFFGVKSTDEENQTSSTIKEIKKVRTEDEPSEDDVTNLDDQPSKSKAKVKAKAEIEEVEEDDDDDDEVTFFEEEKPKKEDKKKTQKEDEDDVEDEDEDNKADEEDKKSAKKDSKKGAKEETEEGEGDDKDDDAKFFSTLAQEMKEKGVFQSVEIEKDKEYTEEEFFELHDKEIEARVEETFEAFFEGLDQDAIDFLKHKKAGGNTADFFATYSTGLDIEKFDEENPEHVKASLNYYLRTVEKIDDEELQDRLTFIKDSGKEKTYAKKYYKLIKDAEEEQREALKEATAKADAAKVEKAKQFQTEFSQVLEKTDAVGDFSISKAEKKELENYINKQTVKVGKNKFIPQLHIDLAKILKAEKEEDKKNLILLSKLVKNNFDVKDLITKTTTEVARKAKSKLMDVKKGIKPNSSGNYQGKKSLTDYFS